MKTAELKESRLDYWVAKAIGERFDEGHALRECGGYFIVQPAITQDDNGEPFAPSELWAHGGLIMQRDRIAVFPSQMRDGTIMWTASVETDALIETAGFYFERPTDACLEGMGTGPTPLIAAMRAFVASKFGEDVPALGIK
jgi:hypothetical protein